MTSASTLNLQGEEVLFEMDLHGTTHGILSSILTEYKTPLMQIRDKYGKLKPSLSHSPPQLPT
jgi:hypothetical protein